MTDADIQTLLRQPPDHALDALNTGIWASVADRERVARVIWRVVTAQAIVLITTLIGSLVAGEQLVHLGNVATLDIFSPQMGLSATTLLVWESP